MISPDVKKMADEVGHLTTRQVAARDPRTFAALDPIERVERSLGRMHALVADLVKELSTLRKDLLHLSQVEQLQSQVKPRTLPKGPLHMTQVSMAAIEDSGLTMSDLRRRDRTSVVVAMRNRAIRALHVEGYSLAEIGRFLNLDHSSVLYWLKKGAMP